MIYICTHNTPKYELDYPHTIIDNNDESNELNIAYEGNRYRHLRGIYNIYRNIKVTEDIGIFQTKRYLPINYIPEGYRCVASKWNGLGTPYEIYNMNHNIHDLIIVSKMINDNDFQEYILNNHDDQYYHNIFIMHPDDFRNYCDFIFTYLFEFDKVTKNKTYEGYNEPVCAFLGERLGSYWIYKNIPKEQIYNAELIEL